MSSVLSKEDAAKVKVVASPDLMEIIDRALPGKDGIPVLYSLANSLAFRIAGLAGAVVNVMASTLRAAVRGDDVSQPMPGMGSTERGQAHISAPVQIDSYNDAMAALGEAEMRGWAFEQAGHKQSSMLSDLDGLCRVRNMLVRRIEGITGTVFASNWMETIAKAAEPREVEEWKKEMLWADYVESCGEEGPELTREEYERVNGKALERKPAQWHGFPHLVLDVIQHYDVQDDDASFSDLRPEMQLRILETLSTPEKEALMRERAVLNARTVSEADARKRLVRHFMTDCRAACNHSRFAVAKADRAARELGNSH